MSCNHNHDCGCCHQPSIRKARNVCHRFGPFNAIDAECITPRAAVGSIIPFASGITPIVLTTAIGALVSTGAFVGFGSNIPSVGVIGATIPLTGLLNEAFAMPRAGTITSISAYFTETIGVTLLGTTTIKAEIFRAPAGSNTFSPTGASVTMPVSGLVSAGQTFHAESSSFPPVAVSAGERLLMVYSSTISGVLTVASVVTGTASAGITIEY